MQHVARLHPATRIATAPLATCVPNGACGGLIAVSSQSPTHSKTATLDGDRFNSVRDIPRLCEAQDDSFSQFTSSCFNQRVAFGARESIRIPKTGDEICGITLEITLPALCGNYRLYDRWRNDIVEAVLQSVVFRVESSPIYSATGYLNAALCTALGKFPTLASARYNASSVEDQVAHSAQPWTLLIPLAIPPMWHDANAFKSLAYSCFHVDLQLARFEELVAINHEADAYPFDNANVNLQLLVHGQYQSTDLRNDSTKKQDLPRVKLCREELAVARKPNLRAGIAALKRWLAHVELSEHNRSLAYRAALLDEGAEKPHLDYYLTHCGETIQNIAQTLLLNPKAETLWTRFCAPGLAVVQRNKTAKRDVLAADAYATHWLPPLDHISYVPMLQYATFDLEPGSAQVFNLDFDFSQTGLILAFSAKDATPCEEEPFESIRLMIGSVEQHACTYAYAREWNWMQCNAKALPQHWQHMCILPFSQYALKWTPRGFPCAIDTDWCGARSLVVTPPLHSKVRWTMHVGAITQNQYVQMHGMAGMRYVR